ncbi:MAG TPA: Ig-like domain-containing protein [Acidobacteriaceae bacterium]|nr:Ig-like domain-containing protein [Acidobacteriaceae bacterium]
MYVFAFNANALTTPGLLLEYDLTPGAATPETVLSSSTAMPNLTYSTPWSRLNYNPESTELALSANIYSSGALALTSQLCAGAPLSLTQVAGSPSSPVNLGYPVVNTVSGYLYAILPASGYPPGLGTLYYVAPPSGCSTSSSTIQISPATLPAGTVGVNYPQTLAPTGGSGTGYMWSVQSGTAFSAVGLTLSSTGTISGTPTGPETEATVVVQVTDSRGNTATQGYLLTINNASTGPAMVSDSDTITVNDSDVVQVIDVNDSETITVTDKVSVAVVGAAAMTLTASPTSATVNGSVTLIATVKAASSTVPSGQVAFTLKGAALLGCASVAVLSSTGVASCITNALPLGQNTVTASYSNDPNITAAPTTVVVSVSQASVAMTLTASPASPSVNSPVTLIATISPNPSGPTVPSGNVAFALNDATLTGCGAVPVGKSGNADRRFAGQCPRTRTGAWECRAAHLHVAVAAAQPRTGVPQAAPWRLAHARCTAFPHRNRKLYCVRRQRLL